ncbi:MAG TPA: type I-U CRISPR-associated protein Csb2 [Pirellulaceae bacterium]|nr:type I-U CRISPR-associated protein Csb2 [Pirellulaceae bacterium]HMO91016.1 type I-U CRISPR-associated protein Csb2 [Pirellulaceae bacterium]HMP68131.1 type I-U CRISPR-associated protein Csb2 [Pirellulaceae bacterium]
MIIMSFEFPARRYHATPWDAHVNEGRIEWPPSPWRLIRALLSVGYCKWNWGDEPPTVVQSLIGKLIEGEPAYCLPQATTAHTRHYMPTRDKPTKVFDAFVRMQSPDARLLVRYDVDVTDEERRMLSDLLSSLTYLGRAESWVEASLIAKIDHAAFLIDDAWCEPSSFGNGKPTRLIAPLKSGQFDDWRTEAAEKAFVAAKTIEEAKAKAKEKQLTPANLKKIRAKSEEKFPISVIDALQLDTNVWQSQGWPQPPGSRWLDYSIPDELLQIPPLRTSPRSGAASATQAVLLSIDGVGKRGTVRPLMSRMLPVMELLHRLAIHKAANELDFGNLPELSGKDASGKILRGHRHCHYLPLSLLRQGASHGKLDHVLVWTPDENGLSAQAVTALAAIRWAYAKGISDLSVNFAGSGTVAELKRQLDQEPKVQPGATNIMGLGRVWQSITPLVFSRYLHSHGKKTPENQIRAELNNRGFDEPIEIRFWSSSEMVERNLKGCVIRRRPGKSQPPSPTSWGATIKFERPQQGPIALGYASHFGLGMFAAVE